MAGTGKTSPDVLGELGDFGLRFKDADPATQVTYADQLGLVKVQWELFNAIVTKTARGSEAALLTWGIARHVGECVVSGA